MNKLLKEYGLTDNYQYYDMIIESMINGQRKQMLSQFNAMPRENRPDFLDYAKEALSPETFSELTRKLIV